MTTPQDSPRRKKQKIRRSVQLAKWREKQATATTADKKTEKKAQKKPAKKTATAAKPEKAAAK